MVRDFFGGLTGLHLTASQWQKLGAVSPTLAYIPPPLWVFVLKITVASRLQRCSLRSGPSMLCAVWTVSGTVAASSVWKGSCFKRSMPVPVLWTLLAGNGRKGFRAAMPWDRCDGVLNHFSIMLVVVSLVQDEDSGTTLSEMWSMRASVEKNWIWLWKGRPPASDAPIPSWSSVGSSPSSGSLSTSLKYLKWLPGCIWFCRTSGTAQLVWPAAGMDFCGGLCPIEGGPSTHCPGLCLARDFLRSHGRRSHWKSGYWYGPGTAPYSPGPGNSYWWFSGS